MDLADPRISATDLIKMAYVEIEYDDFVKALRLLHSRTPESSDELKKMLDSYYVKQLNNVGILFLASIFCSV